MFKGEMGVSSAKTSVLLYFSSQPCTSPYIIRTLSWYFQLLNGAALIYNLVCSENGLKPFSRSRFQFSLTLPRTLLPWPHSKIVSQALAVAGTYAPVLSSAAKIVSEIDVLLSLAVCAGRYDWVRPQLLPLGSQTIDIKVSSKASIADSERRKMGSHVISFCL